MIRIDPDEVHVWYHFPAAFPAALEARALALLSADERARHDRFRFPEGRREFLLTRALVRTTLSRYAAVAPESWRFTVGPNGRPEVVESALRFNLSNTPGLIACVVGAQPELGIDVEEINAERANVQLAERFFSPAEREAVKASPAKFYELWTLKEAYLKARGLGLQVPLDQLWFDLSGTRVIASFGPALNDAGGWQFERLFPSPAHAVSIAVRGLVRVVERTVIPLVEA